MPEGEMSKTHIADQAKFDPPGSVTRAFVQAAFVSFKINVQKPHCEWHSTTAWLRPQLQHKGFFLSCAE